MADNQTEFPSDSEDLGGDKTPAKNEKEDILSDIPEEGDDKIDKEEKVDKSEVAQKVRWRDKYTKLKSEYDSKIGSGAKTEIAPPADDKEKQAQKVLSDFVRKEYQNILTEEKEQEQRAVQDLEDKVDSVLEDNPDVSEEDLLDIVEEFEVEPDVALKILKRSAEVKPAKPRMPSPRRASPASPKEKPDDSGKDLWQIAKEVIADLGDSGK